MHILQIYISFISTWRLTIISSLRAIIEHNPYLWGRQIKTSLQLNRVFTCLTILLLLIIFCIYKQPLKTKSYVCFACLFRQWFVIPPFIRFQYLKMIHIPLEKWYKIPVCPIQNICNGWVLELSAKLSNWDKKHIVNLGLSTVSNNIQW